MPPAREVAGIGVPWVTCFVGLREDWALPGDPSPASCNTGLGWEVPDIPGPGAAKVLPSTQPRSMGDPMSRQRSRWFSRIPQKLGSLHSSVLSPPAQPSPAAKEEEGFLLMARPGCHGRQALGF